MTEIIGLSDEQARDYWERVGSEQGPTRYVVGVDIGQVSDPTAIAVGEYNSRHPVPRPLKIRYLERVPLDTTYPRVVEYIAAMIRAEPLTRSNCDLVVDQTGVGRPLVDMLEAAKCRPAAVTITSGSEATEHAVREFRIPKSDLVAAVSCHLATETLKVAPELRDAAALRSELQSFEVRATTRSETYNAESGAHDDLVIAAALCCWWADHCRAVQVL
jgi:hypothetical protein